MEGWPYKKEKVEHSMRQSRPIRSNLAMIDGIARKGQRIRACELLYWVNMNEDMENTVK